jgi:hypothetical protein
MVENKIPVADLRRLNEQLPEDCTLTADDRASLRTLQRLLNGEFKNGIDPIRIGGLYNDEDGESGAKD